MGFWNGAYINHPSYSAIAESVLSQVWPDRLPQWIVKAGEGGSYQTAFDSSPLAIKSAAHLRSVKDFMESSYGVEVWPYLNVRGTWFNDEIEQFKAVYDAVGFVIVHLEPGSGYYNPNVSQWDYTRALLDRIPGEGMELVSIPRTNSYLDLRLWTDSVQYAAWECYGDVATDLEPDTALNRIDFGKGERFQIPIVQKSMLNRYDDWKEWDKNNGFQVWHLDGNW